MVRDRTALVDTSVYNSPIRFNLIQLLISHSFLEALLSVVTMGKLRPYDVTSAGKYLTWSTVISFMILMLSTLISKSTQRLVT